MLIGMPASGKSTLAQQMANHWPDAVVISSDQIRSRLFGDANAQQDWQRVQAEIDTELTQAIAAGQTVTYDATSG